jgi:hypothetical protein
LIVVVRAVTMTRRRNDGPGLAPQPNIRLALLMREWLLVLKAADAAARWHVHQRRKGPAEEPYINHLDRKAALRYDGLRISIQQE